MYRYARLKHDFQLEEFGYSRRENPLKVTPETVPLNSRPAEGKGPALRLSQEWYEFVGQINSAQGFRIATGASTGWVNEGWGERDTPLVQSLTMGGNVVVVRKTTDDYGRLLAFEGDQPAPDARRFNYAEAPQYVQKFTCIAAQKKILNPANGADCYFPLIGAGELWVPLRRLEWFPELPAKVQVLGSSFLRSSPKKSYLNVVGGLYGTQLVTLRGYAVRASHVWGYVTTQRGKSGFLALLWYPNAAALHYLTSWRMETVPPLPPK
jgi:hypothetical protein